MTPKSTSPMDRIAGPENVHDFVPSPVDLPRDYPHRRHYENLQARWFFDGLPTSELAPPAPGIDRDLALDHLAAVQASFDLPHEHKSRAVAWLMSQWFPMPAEGGEPCP